LKRKINNKSLQNNTIEVSLKSPVSKFGLMLRKVASSQVLSEK
jgi:hypothetical protein